MVDIVTNEKPPIIAATEGEKPATEPTVDVQQLIRAAVEQQVSGLKSKNSELLTELKTERERLRAWEGLDAGEVRKLLQQFEQDEDAKAIRDGRINEVIERRTRTAIEKALNDKQSAEAARQKAEEEAKTYRNRYQTSVVANEVAGKVSGLAPGALQHVQRAVMDWFTVDDNGAIVATEKAPLWPKAEPLRLDELRDYLLESTPFYFVPAAGGGATKGTIGGAGKKRSTMTTAEKAAYIRQHGAEEYHKLPI
jgi:hypothetical protein